MRLVYPHDSGPIGASVPFAVEFDGFDGDGAGDVGEAALGGCVEFPCAPGFEPGEGAGVEGGEGVDGELLFTAPLF